MRWDESSIHYGTMKSDNLVLRPWEKADLDLLCRYADNPKIARYMTDRFPHPYTREAGENFIAITTDPLNAFRFKVIEIDGAFAGGIGIHLQDDVFRLNAELAYWVAEPYWNKGYATKAIADMILYSFSNYEIDRIFARVYGSNNASKRVLEKTGFRLESTIPESIIKNEKLEDCLTYGIRRTSVN